MGWRTTTEAPLAGIRVLLTRPSNDAGPAIAALVALGAEVTSLPAIRVEPPRQWAPLDGALRSLRRYHWLAFTSRNAARAVLGRLQALDVSIPDGVRVAALGHTTAMELRAGGVAVAVQADRPSASDLAEAMLRSGAAGSRVLQPAGNLARPELRDRLTAAGAQVDVIEAYRTMDADLDAWEGTLGQIDVAALFSPSAFRVLLAHFGPSALRSMALVCVGPTTAATVRQAGLQPAAVAAEASDVGMVRAIVSLRGRRET